MIVTLPFVLLLLDYWPLNRFHSQNSLNSIKTTNNTPPFYLILEKGPLFLLTTISCTITFYAQKSGEAITSTNVLTLSTRISTSLIAYLNYIKKMLYPINLSFLYPYTREIYWWELTAAVILLLSVTFLALKTIKHHPYFVVGWFWYLGTLIPVIGFVQIGRQSIADRYTYIPLIGLFIIIAWGMPELIKALKYKKFIFTISTALLLMIFLPLTYKQSTYWKNSFTLYKHAIEVTTNNYIAHNNLGATLKKNGNIEEAIKHFNHALQIYPFYYEAQTNLGLVLAKKGDTKNAIQHFKNAIAIKPSQGKVHYHLGLALENENQLDEAVEHYLKAIKTDSDIINIHKILGSVLFKLGRNNEAIHHYLIALKNASKPNAAKIHNNIGNALYKNGQINEAVEHYLKALEINPDLAETNNNLGVAFIRKGNIDKAILYFQKAIEIKPNYLNAINNLNKSLVIRQNKSRSESDN
jgi:tetratricopeptide (TPR) repeat protein